MKKSLKKTLFEYTILILGCILGAIGTVFLILPAKIGAGGLGGIVIGINALNPNFKVGAMTFIFNIPLFILAYKQLGKEFVFKSVVAVGVSSFFTDFLAQYSYHIFNILPMNDKMLIAIFAGIFYGISSAMVYMVGASGGGADIVSKVVAKKNQELNLSTIQLGLDVVVYCFLGVVLGPSTVVYALVQSYSRKKIIDAIQEGFGATKQLMIICDNEKADEIAEALHIESERGITMWNSIGMYQKKDKATLFTVVHISEVSQVRAVVQDIDENAFISVSSVSSIYGNFKKKHRTI